MPGLRTVAAGIAVVTISLLGCGASAPPDHAFMPCGFGANHLNFEEQPRDCEYSAAGGLSDLIVLEGLEWSDWGGSSPTAMGIESDRHLVEAGDLHAPLHRTEVRLSDPVDASDGRRYYSKMTLTNERGTFDSSLTVGPGTAEQLDGDGSCDEVDLGYRGVRAHYILPTNVQCSTARAVARESGREQIGAPSAHLPPGWQCPGRFSCRKGDDQRVTFRLAYPLSFPLRLTAPRNAG